MPYDHEKTMRELFNVPHERDITEADLLRAYKGARLVASGIWRNILAGRRLRTMVPVSAENATQFVHETWATEASTLGLAPGEWPPKIPTTLGNQLPFVRVSVGSAGARYQQECGTARLEVYND